MGCLEGKTVLVTGIASERSIAYGVAKVLRREGAQIALTYAGERLEARVRGYAEELGAKAVLAMDVTDDAQIAGVFEALGEKFGALDGIVHAVAYAPREAIAGDFLDGFTRENLALSVDVSAYSLAALVKPALPFLAPGASVVTLSYLGAEKYVPNYNTMGVAKAALEATVRYLAGSLGERGVRVNAISAGPVKTLSAAAIAGFGPMLRFAQGVSPLRRCVTAEEIGGAAAFLLSDLASAVTGETLHVDAGFSIVGVQMPPEPAGE